VTHVEEHSDYDEPAVAEEGPAGVEHEPVAAESAEHDE
jgi:hypothetical protein